MKRLMFIFALSLGTHPIHTNYSTEETVLSVLTDTSCQKAYSVAHDIICATKELPNSYIPNYIVSYWKKYRKEISVSLVIFTTLVMGYISVQIYSNFLSERIESFIEGTRRIEELGNFLSSPEGQRAVDALKLFSEYTEKAHDLIGAIEKNFEGLAARTETIQYDTLFAALSPL